MTQHPTCSQTVGPFFQIGLAPLYKADLTSPETPGEKITVQGRVLDAENQPVPDAVLEVWQADSQGRYAHPEDPSAALAILPEATVRSLDLTATKSPGRSDASPFQGFGRIPTNEQGLFQFASIKPGAVAAPDGTLQLPHIVVSLFMRGLLRRLVTRIYFPPPVDSAQPLDPSTNPAVSNDFILKYVPAQRRHTLFAIPSPKQPGHYAWTIHLQGLHETVFFDI